MEISENLSPTVVDLDLIIKQTGNRFLKSLPGFLVTLMKRILHQNELNALHARHYQKIGAEYTNAILKDLGVDVHYYFNDKIDRTGRYIYVANHPLGGIDALSFLKGVHQLHGIVVSPSNDLFNYVPNLRPLIVGVNVFGKTSKEKSETIIKAFESDLPIMIFPAGKVSRKIKGKVQDTEWHKAIVTKAIQTKRDVVPVFISGKNSRLFYNISKIRALLGLKLTVETLLLPHEMLRNKGMTIHIVFGDPISYKTFDRSKNHQQWTAYVREKVYQLSTRIVNLN